MASAPGMRLPRSRCGPSSAPACIPSPPSGWSKLGPLTSDANVRAATQLGAPFKVYAGDVSPFQVEVAKRIAIPHGAGHLGDVPVSATDRAQVRTEVARE